MRRWKEDNRQHTRDSAKARKTTYRTHGLSVSEAYRIIKEGCDQYKIGDKYLDVYSGELIDSPSVDHVVALSKGGKHEVDNLCVTSAKSNNEKHAHSLIMFLWRRAALRGPSKAHA
jgi:5-methylcytosine-specific restriction endonuclease McrA